MPPAPLVDSHGRLHDNLRLGVTDRCNIRCFYCMSDDAVEYQPRAGILSYEELERVARVAAALGVTKLRVTGGEPLVRPGLPSLIERLVAIDGIRDVAVTTNGILLASLAQPLYQAGLRRLNVHLDTLDRQRFATLARRDELPRVLAGLDAASALGFAPIKLNAVAVHGLSEPDIVPLARFARERGYELRYIEFMPLDGQQLWSPARVLTMDAILAVLRAEVGELDPVPGADPRAPALHYRWRDGRGQVGFIASVSRPFCANCNRLRLTADGKLRYCLFALEELDLKAALRSGASDAELAALFRRSVAAKWPGHQINSPQFVAPPRPMHSIGG
jgi:cyclic pyranopterin phosphate synthase